jgi:hypothetical protein
MQTSSLRVIREGRGTVEVSDLIIQEQYIPVPGLDKEEFPFGWW